MECEGESEASAAKKRKYPPTEDELDRLATEQWLLDQTNATKDATLASEAVIDWSRTARSKMMASQVFGKYKYALVRAEISFATRRLLVGYSLVDSQALIYKGPRPRDPLQRVGKAEIHGGSGNRRGVANLFAS